MTKARDLASAALAPSTVSATEIGYLDGVSSAIQTQIDGKIAKTLTTTTGDIIYASSANTPARLGIGSTGNVLTVSGGVPAWAAPAGGGKVLQVVQATYGTETNIATTTWTDSGLSATITPSAASSKVLVMVSASYGVFSGTTGELGTAFRILRGSTFIFGSNDASAAYDYGYYLYATSASNFTFMGMLAASYLDSPSTTSATTYKVQGSALSGKTARFFNDGQSGSMILMEIGA
jgi:hypothetical protein